MFHGEHAILISIGAVLLSDIITALAGCYKIKGFGVKKIELEHARVVSLKNFFNILDSKS